uniref:Uncharacterized protein n=2 Tax=Chrysoporthe TaxID=305399 RepID=A0A191MX27_9PEZI|nr:hypothetical protein [Chrysoporthe austroafricana]YP_009262156.1 hypothetical protein [Chrysoporthe cubensis]AMX22094.1 hypothetical protein [Chrysoporthe austroafricana]AMX22231.1 hypothetical protein [Chrysoporthe cubensis]
MLNLNSTNLYKIKSVYSSSAYFKFRLSFGILLLLNLFSLLRSNFYRSFSTTNNKLVDRKENNLSPKGEDLPLVFNNGSEGNNINNTNPMDSNNTNSVDSNNINLVDSDNRDSLSSSQQVQEVSRPDSSPSNDNVSSPSKPSDFKYDSDIQEPSKMSNEEILSEIREAIKGEKLSRSLENDERTELFSKFLETRHAELR